MPYAKDLVAQLTKRTPLELTWELQEALNEALEADFEFSDAELLAWHVCTVAHCDGIAEVLESQPESIPIAAKFARERGLLETAGTLEKVAKGIGADEPVSMSMKIRGKTTPVDLPETAWGAFDLLLSLVDEDLDTAILDFVAENIKEFTLPAPASVLKRAKKKKKVAEQVAQKSAAQLLRELLAHKSPRLRCTLSQADGSFSANQTIEVPVVHSAESAMTSQRCASLKKQYGGAATALLELLAEHDGASLFCVGGEAALYLLPSARWAEHMENVMSWAQEVTWQDDPDEIPRYLSSAIPFAHIPGDSERWLLITEGAHAGKVMLSDSDVIEDAPRFDSVAEFIGTLMVDASRIVGCGGYICYDANGQNAGGGEGCYYPQKYLFSA
jgi:hypothetical protein